MSIYSSICVRTWPSQRNAIRWRSHAKVSRKQKPFHFVCSDHYYNVICHLDINWNVIISLNTKLSQTLQWQMSYHLRPTGFCPFHVENQVIVTVSIQRCNSFGSIILFVVMNESKALALTSLLILGKIYSGNMSKRLEQFLQISLLRTFGKIWNPDSSSVFVCKEE